MTHSSVDDILFSKENLLRVLDNLDTGIVAHDTARRIFVFNREAERITGFPREEVIGRDCHEVFGSPLCGSRCSFCGDTVFSEDQRSYPLNLVSHSGEVRQVEMSLTAMKKPDGSLWGVLASMRDVTDLFDLRLKAADMGRFSGIIGNDPKMLQIFQQIRDVSQYDFPVHITGDTGTGKELVAAAIHSESPRSEKPFVPINCGALPEGLIESELFGHVKGSFSGAVRDKKGRFELAHGGTVFLDEVAELSKHMQVKLLRFLQEGSFERVGGEQTLKVDVRIVSATNKDLKKEVLKGDFRDDLYYRLNVVPIRLPALRERRNDIPHLVRHFMEEAARQYPHTSPRISREALGMLMDYSWPGNVRELQNAVRFAIVKSGGGEIGPLDLPLEIRGEVELKSRKGPSRKLDADTVAQVLLRTDGNKAKAAKLLGVGRATLYRFLKDYPELYTGS
ncbi:sigma-54 interaction domain-containing protein [Desulfobotulus sp.]|jgi:PAS domain S-box-containing protein|uniref:sigma-54 interaction domain-containing protein n=1 Tax=Desulfobotulus sp. TaxID=1940337 RepID=UPI002A359C3D|nr:sigma 54-interacting transcriptional regulator [Desulfobotulus sp.]MDY0162099.1 sigma 54-interacting transcriptional regulator [Desulfobotulus sp.]